MLCACSFSFLHTSCPSHHQLEYSNPRNPMLKRWLRAFVLCAYCAFLIHSSRSGHYKLQRASAFSSLLVRRNWTIMLCAFSSFCVLYSGQPCHEQLQRASRTNPVLIWHPSSQAFFLQAFSASSNFAVPRCCTAMSQHVDRSDWLQRQQRSRVLLLKG